MTENFWIRFVPAVLATWRITYLMAYEDGPAGLIAHFRARLGRSFAGRLLGCFHCLSMWVAAPMAFFVTASVPDVAIAWLAISGAACLLERTGRDPVVIQRLPETQGDTDHVLR